MELIGFISLMERIGFLGLQGLGLVELTANHSALLFRRALVVDWARRQPTL